MSAFKVLVKFGEHYMPNKDVLHVLFNELYN
jgi:hypothetical protein